MTAAARLYGDSLYELAGEENLTDTILEEMLEIRTIFKENPDYLHLLGEPSIPKKERTELVEQAFGNSANRYLVNYIKLLCERNLLMEYAGSCEEFVRRYNADHDIAQAVVTSAVALSPEQLKALQEKLEHMSGKKISLEQRLDASVVAGLKVELEGKLLDGTVQGRLSELSRKMKETVL